MDYHSEGPLIETDHAHHQKEKIINKPSRRMSFLLELVTIKVMMVSAGRVTIDILPDDVLLEIFDYYLVEDKTRKVEEWQILVHVCQKWRYVVFQSPLRLNLRILCSTETRVREKLALWPPFPIFIKQWAFSTSECYEDNIIAALGHDDRVCAIDLSIPGSLLETVFPEMQKTFVALKDLRLYATDEKEPVVSDSFLGGSAPHLRHLKLFCVPFPFPILRNLLLSAPNLVTLVLDVIPHSGYFSPGEIVTCLSALTRLNHLCIGFKSPLSFPPQEGWHPPPIRSVLPALTKLMFNGVSEYLEGLVTRIDAPLLDSLNISFRHQLIFNTPQLVQFISRTPKFKAYDEARVTFSHSRAVIALPGRGNLELELGTLCRQSDRQLLSMAHVCTSSFPQALIPRVEHLYVLEDIFWPPLPSWQDYLVNNRWLDFFHPFTTVKNLYLSRESVRRIAPTLQEIVGERVTEVLPNLQRVFLEGESEFVPEAMGRFIAARQLSGRPIVVSHWTR